MNFDLGNVFGLILRCCFHPPEMLHTNLNPTFQASTENEQEKTRALESKLQEAEAKVTKLTKELETWKVHLVIPHRMQNGTSLGFATQTLRHLVFQ